MFTNIVFKVKALKFFNSGEFLKIFQGRSPDHFRFQCLQILFKATDSIIFMDNL